jgi:transcription-repair coupling factor (superfamily II helicase)
MDRTAIEFGLPLPGPSQPHIVWGQLYGCARSLAIAEALRRHAGWVCVLADSATTAGALERELAFFGTERGLRRFSDYETLPYDAFTPPQDLLAERLATLYDLAEDASPQVLLVNAAALLNRLPPPDFLTRRSLELSVGAHLDLGTMRRRLVQHGYLNVEQVAEPGEFAVRGALLDVFPSGAAAPVRVDVFDEEIESLRRFDPETQLTTQRVTAVRVLPAREFPFDEEGIRGFRARFRAQLPGNPGRSSIYNDISQAELPPGIEYYLPLFFDRTVTLLDYLPAGCLLLLTEGALAELGRGWRIIEERFEQLSGDLERPILPPEQAFWNPAELEPLLAARPRLELRSQELPDPGPGRCNAASAHPLAGRATLGTDPIGRWLDASANLRSLIVATSLGRREAVAALLQGRGVEVAKVDSWGSFVASTSARAVIAGEIEIGMRLPEVSIEVVTAEQLGVERPTQRARRRRAVRAPEAIIRELTDLRIGAPVVHEEYGVGRYLGLTTLDVDGILTEFLTLEYAGADKLYVPVQNLHLVTRYSGASAEDAPLHRLGSDQWNKARQRAARAARDAAAELLNIYAQRAARPGAGLELSDDSYQRFALEFPFEETEDQLDAINEVLKDLASDKPMDRLVCGDVGFGKTEVALRAAFVAVHAGHQVAVLVPTTLLAQQHYRTFSDRFAEWPVHVEMLSRFRSAKEIKEVLAGLADGHVDIVIGTHRLLQADVKFKRLGLVIVDEEHRFGVRHKERLKQMKANVHWLTLTATPIPRTLNMTLGGLKDLSIIATPPVDRLAVKTFVGEWNDRLVRDALIREMRRGGQAYFVHNRVEDIEHVAKRVAELVPEAEIRVAHGQMPERALETVMLEFYQRRFNVLVCSTIIESGIDVPNANTIVINRAHHFGLAELHQLRGRVGRSHHQAYAYLIAPALRTLSADAAKRLEAIEALEELGSGFTLATHDLEIRGAGEVLGEEQSGQIHAVGFALYNELLARAVGALRHGREPALDDPFHHGPEVALGLTALIPEDYMPDVHMRLVHYKRIANAASQQELDELQVELIDRFGLLPPPTKNLFEMTWLKLLAQAIGIVKIQGSGDGGSLKFAKDSEVDPRALVGLVSDHPAHYRLDGAFKLNFKWRETGESARLAELEALLRRLGASPPCRDA